MALLPDIAALSVHGKDVHDAVAVREKIYTLIPKHRIAGGTRPIRRQGRRLAAAVEPPKSLVVAALVALGEAGLFSPTGKEECAAVRAVSRLRTLRQRHDIPAAASVEQHELGVRQRGEAVGAHHQATIGRPSDRNRVSIPGASFRNAARERQRVNIAGSLVLADEGNAAPVGRNPRHGFDAGVGGQAFGCEHDGVAMHGRVTIIPAASPGIARRRRGGNGVTRRHDGPCNQQDSFDWHLNPSPMFFRPIIT